MDRAKWMRLVLGVAAVLVALILLAVPVSSLGDECGTVLAPSFEEPLAGVSDFEDTFNRAARQGCQDARGGRTWVSVVVGVGGVVLVVSSRPQS